MQVLKVMVKKIFLNRFFAKRTIRFFLKLDSVLYKLISRLSILANEGVHPKKDIIKYEEWFLSKLRPNETVLEVGSHKGEMSQALARHVNKVFAIEINKNLHDYSKRHKSSKNINYINADATKYDFSDMKVNTVVLSNVLEHIEERNRFLKDLIDRVHWEESPRFLIRVPMITRDWLAVYKKRIGVTYFLDPTHFIEYDHSTLNSEISNAGLIINDLKVEYGESYLECLSPSAQ